MSVDEVGERVARSIPDRIGVDQVRTLLGLLRTSLKLDVAWLSSFTDGDLVLEVLDGDAAALGLSPGDRFSLAGTYCIRVVDGRLPVVISDTSANQVTSELPITRDLKLGAYVGAPILDEDGVAVGSLCAVSRDPKPYLDDADKRIVNSMADLLSALMRNPDAAAPKLTPDHRGGIRQVVSEQDFEVVFQAIHDILTGAVVGVEALTRFPCEPFQPDVFIEEASALGLGVELETAIVRRVFSLIPELPAEAFVSVNISPAAALVVPWDELFVEVDPSRIVLEITEHESVKNYAALSAVLGACRSRGLRLAVDDMGSGFSSFTHVLELGPDFVKIDRSITRDIHLDEARRSLTQAIAEFAEQMGVTVIAEGIENQDELDAIGDAGVPWGQGYYLGRPKAHTQGFPASDATTAPAGRAHETLDLIGTRRFEYAMAHSTIGMAVVSLDGTFLRTNRALCAMLGYSRQKLRTLTFQTITAPEDLDADLELLTECLNGQRRSYRMVKRFIGAEGRIVWGDMSTVLMRDPRGQPRCFISQVLDVTADRAREADLVRRAATDPLTGIVNRAAAWSKLEELAAHGAGYGVVFCDIEQFKSINDRRGHYTGDQVLVAVADGLGAVVRADDMVARWGGDEFLVITGPIDDSGLALLAHRIITRVQSATIMMSDDSNESITLSVGIATHTPGDGQTIDDILDRANHAMYEQRRNRISGTE